MCPGKLAGIPAGDPLRGPDPSDLRPLPQSPEGNSKSLLRDRQSVRLKRVKSGVAVVASNGFAFSA